MDIIKKITSWNKLLWIVTVIIWSIVCVQWVASSIDPETGQRWHKCITEFITRAST